MHYECYRYHLTRSQSSGKASGWAIKESPATLALMAQEEAYLNAAHKNAAIAVMGLRLSGLAKRLGPFPVSTALKGRDFEATIFH